MLYISRSKFLNYYLPIALSVVLVAAAGIAYKVFTTNAGGGAGGNGTNGAYIQQGGKYRQVGGKVVIGSVPPISLVEVAKSGRSASTPSVNFNATTTKGETIIVFGGTGAANANPLNNPTDNMGDTYTQVFNKQPSPVNANYALWYAANVPAGVTTVSATVGTGQSNSNSEIIVAHYKGLSATPLDTSTATTTRESSPWTSDAIATSVANELLVGGDFCWNNGTTQCTSTTFAMTGAWTMEATTTNAQGGEDDVLIFGDQIVSSLTPSASSTGSGGSSGSNSPWIAAFKGHRQ